MILPLMCRNKDANGHSLLEFVDIFIQMFNMFYIVNKICKYVLRYYIKKYKSSASGTKGSALTL